MEQNNQSIDLIITNSFVSAIYDGFQVKVIIETCNSIECACYLYSQQDVLFKSSYKNDKEHIFSISNEKIENLRVLVFFKFIDDKSIKKSIYYPVTGKTNLRYSLSENISNEFESRYFEIEVTPFNSIEAFEKYGFRPRRDNKPSTLDIPINWLEDPFNDRNWMFQLQAWRMLDSYLERSSVSDLDYISKVINDWTQFERNHIDKWLWYDMSTGLRALKICFYLIKCHEKNVDHKINELEYLLHEHLKHLISPEELSSSNHGLFQLHGLKCLTYILTSIGNDAYNFHDVIIYANREMESIIISQLGSEGVHTENSPDYHFFVQKRISKILGSIWWSDLDKGTLELVTLADKAKPWLVFPNNRCVPVGDSTTGAPVSQLRDLEEWPSTSHGNYIGAKLGGYAVVRSKKNILINNSSFLFFQGSFYSHHHKHADDLSFILQERGINILIDPGKYSYEKDEFRKYFLSTRAHNTITVDGKDTSRNPKYAYGSALCHAPLFIDKVWILKGQVEHIYNQYTHLRCLVYNPGVELYVIDTVINHQPNRTRRVEQWWNFDSDLDVNKVNSNQVEVEIKSKFKVFIQSETSGETISVKSYKGYKANNTLIGWNSRKYLNYEPSPTISYSTILHDKAIILTRFSYGEFSSNVEPLIKLYDKNVSTKSKILAKYFSD